MIEVTALQSLLAVDAAGSVAGAAATLGYTPSAVSQQIKRLERDVGATLLERVGRGVVLTRNGRLLVAEGRAVLAGLEGIRSRLAANNPEPQGTVRISAFATAVRGLVGPLARELAGSGVGITVTEKDPAFGVDDVAAGTADLCLVHGWTGVRFHLPSGLVAHDLVTDTADLLVHRDHPLAGREFVVPGELLDETWASMPPGTICHAWFSHMFAGHPHVPPVAYRLAEYESQLRLAALGVAVALVPRLGRGPLPPEVVAVEIRDPVPTRTVQAVHRATTGADPAIRFVIDRLATLTP